MDHASAEDAKHKSATLFMGGVPANVTWSSNFGLGEDFNYDIGECIIPLAELNTHEKDNLENADIVGLQGRALLEKMISEEPSVQYISGWTNDDLHSSNGSFGGRSSVQRTIHREWIIFKEKTRHFPVLQLQIERRNQRQPPSLKLQLSKT